MNVLPNSWQESTVGKDCLIVKGKKPRNSGERSNVRNIPYINIKAFEMGYAEQYAEAGDYPLCQEDDVLIVWDGARSGLIGRGVSGYIGSTLAMITSSSLNKKLLFYFLQSKYTEINTRTKGVGIPHVNPQILSSFSLPIPPQNEQVRIVAEIEKQFTRLEAGISALKRVQANLKRYRAAVLNTVSEGGLLSKSADWPHRSIASVIQSMEQGWSPKCESEASDNDAVWAVIKTTAIQNLHFLEDENKRLPSSLKPRVHLELQIGDLLVTRAGPRSRVGVACLVRKTRPRLMLCDKAYRLRCKSELVHPAFLELILNAPRIVDEVNKLKTGISDSGVNLTQKGFGELVIPLPRLSEQRKIVVEVERLLSVVDEIEAAVQLNLNRATRLRQSILQKAFSGQLETAPKAP